MSLSSASIAPEKVERFPVRTQTARGYADGGVNNTEHASIFMARFPGIPSFSSTSFLFIRV